MIIDVKPKDLGLPTEAYISVEEVHDVSVHCMKCHSHTWEHPEAVTGCHLWVALAAGARSCAQSLWACPGPHADKQHPTVSHCNCCVQMNSGCV